MDYRCTNFDQTFLHEFPVDNFIDASNIWFSATIEDQTFIDGYYPSILNTASYANPEVIAHDYGFLFKISSGSTGAGTPLGCGMTAILPYW